MDPEDDNPYDKESFLHWYGNDDGHVCWAVAVTVLELTDGFTSTSTMELVVDPETPVPTTPDPTRLPFLLRPAVACCQSPVSPRSMSTPTSVSRSRSASSKG